MKAPKNRKKAFRVDCVNCHATQDSLRLHCGQCHKPLYTNIDASEMEVVTGKVAAMEEALDRLGAPVPEKGSPYDPADRAWATYKSLRTYHYLPGMADYLNLVLEVLLPLKVHLLMRTVRANWIFLAVMLAFPLVTALFRMHFSITVLLLLPAAVWALVALKATKDLNRTRERLAQITKS
jgi:hypothetical protein